MWCDDFDMDVLKVIPDAAEILLPAREIKLITHGHVTDGKLNSPTVWNTYEGLTAYFVLDVGQDVEAANGARDAARAARPQREWTPPFAPASHWTDDPAVRCTGEEAIRDWWVHQFNMVVAGRSITPPRREIWFHFQRLMYHRRCTGLYTERERDESRAWAQGALRVVVKNLLFAATPAEAVE